MANPRKSNIKELIYYSNIISDINRKVKYQLELKSPCRETRFWRKMLMGQVVEEVTVSARSFSEGGEPF